MNPKLLHNQELDNYKEQDSFNFLTKADAIKIFLEQNSTALEKSKMLVLYGDWGSGKTSLMRYINDNVDPNIYKPIFFHAWEHEKDENLALSLCDALTDGLNRNSQIVKNFMKDALIAFKSFASGITLKAPGFLTGIGLDLEISGEKIIEQISKSIDNTKNPSFYKTNKEFKEKFIEVEQLILKQAGAQKILVFVDDLDRCEPENVLNLITALKLFFTYGEKTVFFCGMDKEAVTKAVKTKYKDVVKAEEYLEKVFDVAFNMPKIFSLQKILQPHFPGDVKLTNGRTYSNQEIIEDFFKSIRFIIPRHLKKVLSKYEILKSFKVLSAIPKEMRDLIPDIILDEQNGNVFETIYCLFFIILYEFNNQDFIELEAYEEKMTYYIEPIYRYFTAQNDNYKYNSAISYVTNTLTLKDYKTFNVKNLVTGNSIVQRQDDHKFTKFILLFAHTKPTYLTDFSDKDIHVFQDSFKDKEFLTLYCKFLIKYKNDILHYGTDYPIWNLFEMVKYLL
ncbi:KAP family P-loop NTPase fold protein [Mucilaginibacter sp. McL0603]|uniref:KAP family P-loop NTPase fold protein n=1 Tax=Mucilaginibacter sp. McL0603 TaxID=3415670 RepID=UPI003CE88E6A